MDFEWDDAKAEANWRKHGVDFPDAIRIFDDLKRIEWLDPREDYGEDRFCSVGEVQGRLLFVAYTMRAERIRVITARKASRNERREYHGDREA